MKTQSFLRFVTFFMLVTLLSCEDEEIIPTVDNRYKITLTRDFEIREVAFYAFDTLVSVAAFEYLDSLIKVKKTNGNDQLLQLSIYYMQDHLADSCIDSTYINSALRSVDHRNYSYNAYGYRTNEIITTENYTSGTDYYLTGLSLSYNYIDGNNSSIDISAGCSWYYTHTDQENKINLSAFIGNYGGRIDKNLKKTFNSGCHGAASTVPESSEYSWILDEQGLVREGTEIHSSAYHIPEGKPKKTKIITTYDYVWVE